MFSIQSNITIKIHKSIIIDLSYVYQVNEYYNSFSIWIYNIWQERTIRIFLQKGIERIQWNLMMNTSVEF